MDRRLGFFVGLLVGGLTLTGQASAISLYSQAPQTFYDVDFQMTFLTRASFSLQDRIETSDNFTIGSTATADLITWYGVDVPALPAPASDDFTINFYSDASGAPGASLASFAVGNGVTRSSSGFFFGGDPNWEVFRYTAPINVQLNAATGYHVSIVNNPPRPSSWAWGIADTDDGHYSRASGAAWVLRSSDMAFSLDGELSSVPEPTSCLLLGLGAVGTGLLRRRQKL